MLNANPNRDLEDLKYAAAMARRPFEKDWWINIAFFLGEQYVEWAADDLTLRKIREPEEEMKRWPRPVINKINHFVLQQHAAALESRPTADVLPADDGEQAISSASVAKAAVDWLADPQVANFGSALSEATLWALICGPGWLYWPYDEKLGRPDITAPSPFDIFLDPYVTRARRARYLIHSRYLDPEQVYDMYGVDVPPDSMSQTDLTKARLLMQMGQAPVLRGVTVNTLWHLPTRRHPQGRMVVWAGKHRLYDAGRFPYAHKHLPYTMIGVIPRPGTPWYDSSIKYLREPQMELNQYHAQRIQVRKNFASPKWSIPDELDMQELPDDSPFQVLRFAAGNGLKPEIIQGTPMADNGEGQWIGEEMMNVVGLHEVSQAQVPGRVEAAKAIEMLKEDDTSRLAELTETTKDAIAEGFWQTLQLMKQFMPADKILQTYTPEGLPEVRKFKKDAINEGQRILVTMNTGLGRSRAAREDRVFKLIEMGILTDPSRIAQLLEVPIPHLSDATIHDTVLARNENYLIANGQGLDGKPGTAVMPNSWDDHGTHIREHNNYRKTIDFQLLDPEIKQKFEFHVQQHEHMWLVTLQQQLQRAQLMQAAASPVPMQPQRPPQGGDTSGGGNGGSQS